MVETDQSTLYALKVIMLKFFETKEETGIFCRNEKEDRSQLPTRFLASLLKIRASSLRQVCVSHLLQYHYSAKIE